ncbi:T9SS type A sorting domain-containing protein, partial [candidate division KSB1 bacterium]
ATLQHYRFSHWTVDGANDASATLQVKMDQDHIVTAQFVKKQYTVTAISAPAEAGDLIPKNPTQYTAESLVRIEAKAVEGSPYVFSRWLLDPPEIPIVDPEQASTDITLLSDVKVTAVFVKKKVTLALQGHPVMGDVYIKMAGDADSSKAAATYELTHGTRVRLYAVSTDADKYAFSGWSGDIETSENPLDVTVESNMTVIANFEDTTPVELASFVVQYAPNSVSRALLLKWQTASETNNLGFDVERSIGNDSNWKKIGFLEGHGTTTEAKFYEFIDEEATTEGVYFYRLKQNDTNGAFEYSGTVQFSVSAPSEYGLAQNYPNPFNPSTQIVFQLKEDVQVNLSVYDLLGRQVATVVDQQMKAGTHKVTFDAADLSAGLYFYSLRAGSFHEMKKMTLIR